MKSLLKKSLCVLGILLGVSLILTGLYVGIVTMLIGGVVDIINQIKATTTSTSVVAYAIAKIVFAECVCGIIVVAGGFVTAVSGATLTDEVMKSKAKKLMKKFREKHSVKESDD